MLWGEFKHNVDSKNRLFIPAKHREELGDAFIIARSTRAAYLRVYSLADWDEYCNRIKATMKASEKETVIRFLNRNAVKVSPDAQGRVIVPPTLLQYAQINGEAYVVGCGDYAEIWAVPAYEKLIAEEDVEQINALLESCGL